MKTLPVPGEWFKQNVFILSGMVGIFCIGCLVKFRVRSSILLSIMVSSFVWTILGTYFLVGTLGERFSQFVYDSCSVRIVIASIALFLLLLVIPAKHVMNHSSIINRFLHRFSQNTLAIYLFHVMVLEILQKGYLGFKISVTTMNQIIEIPLITAITLVVCLVVLAALKKIPYLKNIIG